MFIHQDFMHILYNMFALWMFGYLLENVWGPKRFLTFYMITGIGAAVVQTLVTWWDISSIQAAAAAYNDAPSLDGFVGFVRRYYPNYYQFHDTIKGFIGQWTLAPTNPELIQALERVREPTDQTPDGRSHHRGIRSRLRDPARFWDDVPEYVHIYLFPLSH